MGLQMRYLWSRPIISAIVCFLILYICFESIDKQTVLPHVRVTVSRPSSADQQSLNSTDHFPSVPDVLEKSMVNVLAQLYKPKVIPITHQKYTDADGDEYVIEGEPHFTKPLGKDLLILDTDSRPFTEPNEILSNGTYDWSDAHGLSNGMLNHYMYSQIHGYDYLFIKTPKYEDRGPSWAKPVTIANLLPRYRFVVFVDSDAIFHRPEVPFEWLLNHWGATDATALALATDPPEFDYNRDTRGRVVHNTGFVVAQNVPRAHALLRDWVECPDELRHEDCAKWKNVWSFDQGAFAEYVRYAFDQPDDILDVPCGEANGYPESEGSCDGKFIRHFWIQKDKLKAGVADSMMQVLVDRLHEDLLMHRDAHLMESPSNRLGEW
ncbi:hypothetical protein BDY21DRAFT_362607 [Lineolata rhizophorae]|uniref:Nucleotide-diphospho-sugar transferase domain-containing protein n=1 Tax=Lineolata rhizophorae TaxID=578093 RepID=A0A6A6P5Q8_9PEZI|nr:hypothetical protein BDY21DRAFT_362607 [Lineolata rhizophorae]